MKASGQGDPKPLYGQTIKMMDRAGKLGFEGASDAKQLQTSLERDRALARRGLGNFDAAMKELTASLGKSNSNLQLQIEAAKTLQMWGVVGKRKKALEEALGGSGKYTNPKTNRKGRLVWGWKFLVDVLKNKKKYKSTFHECFLHWLETKFEYAKTVNNTNAIKNILKDIENARKRNPDLGGFKDGFSKLESMIKAHK